MAVVGRPLFRRARTSLKRHAREREGETSRVREEGFDAPYIVVSYPFGILSTVEFIEGVCRALGRDVNYEVVEKEERMVQEAISDAHLFLEGITAR